MSALQEVLKMSIEAQGDENSPPSQKFQPMDEGDKKWLAGALSSFAKQSTDLAKIIKANLQTVSDLLEGEVTQDKIQQINAVLEEITPYVDDLDLAIDFVKMGGHEVMLECLAYKPLITESCEILACISQNNPKVQQTILENNTIQIYLSLLSDQNLEDIQKKKVLYALSCVCRGFEPAIQVFISEKGIQKLLPFVQNLNSLLATKTVFLIKSLVSENVSLKDEIRTCGMLETIISKLKEPRNSTHEQILSLIASCLTDDKDTVEFCKQPRVGLIRIIKNYTKQEDIFEEERESCEQIASLLD